jgi:hypothetical protein
VASIEELLAEDLRKRSGGTSAERRRALREKRKIRSGEAEKKLAALLKNGTPEIRAAADLLAEIDDSAVREPLIKKIARTGEVTVKALRDAVSKRKRERQEDDANDGAMPKADLLIELGSAAELTHNAETGYATFANQAGARVTSPIRSRAFRDHLRGQYYDETGRGVADATLQTAIDTLHVKAVRDGAFRPVRVRVARFDGRVFIDLGGQYVVVRRGRWQILATPPDEVGFVRPENFLPLPAPKRGASVKQALKRWRRYLNLPKGEAGDRRFRLCVAFVLAALSGRKPYPMLLLYGPAGAAKSSAARALRNLIDPNELELRSPPKDERDLAIASTRSHVIAYDNVSHIPPWLSDALCGLSTERAFATRTLYEDKEETSFKAARPVVVTSVVEVVAGSDLLSRAILVQLEEILEEGREEEAKLDAAFAKDRPYILGALLDVLASALDRLSRIRPKRLPRLADFARLMIAAEKKLGWKAGTFLDDYHWNECAGDLEALAAAPVSAAVLRLIEEGPKWEGTFEELLLKLNATARPQDRDLKSWPKTGRGLSAVLHRVAPNLRRRGVTVKFLGHKNRGSLVQLVRTAF